jgi:uncharacterized protein
MSEKGIVFFPERAFDGTPQDWGIKDFEDVFFPAADGTRLHGWWVPGPDSRGVIVWFHGNAGNISHRLDNLRRLLNTVGFSIFIFDYREFGRSEGTISKAGTFLDAEGVLRYLTIERRLSPGELLLFGRSLGTALAVHAARSIKPLGMVLEAAFTGTLDMLHRYFPFGVPSSLTQTVYDNLSFIDRITCPILFIHGAEDQAIPVSMGQTLFDKATAPKFFYEVPNADHNDTYLVGGEAYFEKWRSFVSFCLRQRGLADS